MRGHILLYRRLWHRRNRNTPIRGRKRKIEDAAARKRLLTARHNGWSERGGRGRGLLGAAGENALASALAHPGPVVNASGSTTTVLGVDLNVAGLGEIDNTAWLIDHSNASKPELILVLFEAKNTRQWYYAHDPDVVLFLTKAAVVQAANPAQLVMPVFVCRQVHFTLWELGEHHGFLPVTVENQLVLPDHEVTPERFAEVRDGLYADLVLGDKPTNRHIGAVTKAIPKYARHRADLWRQNHGLYLPAHPV